jgi:2-iminobutanoate/2-iminopropanoate deaminase
MSIVKRVRSQSVAEPPPGSFSQCLMAGDTIYVSGQIARGEDGSIGGDGSMYSQAMIALGRIKALLEAAGATMDDVVKLNVFCTDITKRVEIGEARRKFFTGDFPASTLVQVAALVDPGLLVEIEATAVRAS